MTASTEKERAEYLSWIRANYADIYSAEEAQMMWDHGHLSALAWKEQAARRAPAVPVPQSIEQMAVDRYKVVPSHISVFYPCAVVAGDGQQQLYIGREAECQNMARKFTGAFLDGAFVALAAAPQPAAAAPVQLPEPVAFALEWTFNGEERGMRLYDDETHCRFDAESDGGVCHPLYTEQQVRQLLAACGIEDPR